MLSSFERLLEQFGVADVGVGESRLLRWYDDSLYRDGLYVTPAS